jgi:uncharacterized membrane-anchored protein
MISNKMALTGLIILCLAQLFVAGRMISTHEAVLKEGVAYKFKTAPIDPNDPFRGKYITLNFENNELNVPDATQWHAGQRAYGRIKNNDEGFAIIDQLVEILPDTEEPYFEMTIGNIINTPEEQKVFLNFPFDRFYLEEKKAPEAEQIYREALASGSADTYALVYIKAGRAVIEDVLVGDLSIKNLGRD